MSGKEFFKDLYANCAIFSSKSEVYSPMFLLTCLATAS